MELINDDLLFSDSVIRMKKLDTPLNLLEIKKCMYKFNAESVYQTNVEISEWDGCTVMFKGKSFEAIENDWEYLKKIVNSVIAGRKEDKNHNKFQNQVYITENDRTYARPYDILSSKYVNQYSNGRLYVTGHVAGLFEKLDKLILKFAESEKAIEFYSEPLWHEEELPKFGYTPNNDNLFQINHFNDEKKLYWQNATCDNIWKSFENSVVDDFKVYSALGVCSRTEKNQVYFYERMNVFHMREIVAVGEKEQIIKFRERAIEFVIGLGQKLQLNFLLEQAGDPFFIEDNSKANHDGDKYDLPEIIKIEYRPYLYDDKTLACASFNIHGDFFAKKFNYSGKTGKEPIWTSCIAFGLERWCWAILVQFGTDFNKWPSFLKKLY